MFRDDKGRLLDSAYTASFLTAAAPNLGAIMRNQPEHADDVPAVLSRRARLLALIGGFLHSRIWDVSSWTS